MSTTVRILLAVLMGLVCLTCIGFTAYIAAVAAWYMAVPTFLLACVFGFFLWRDVQILKSQGKLA